LSKKKNSGETAAHRDLRKRLVSHEMRLWRKSESRSAKDDGAKTDTAKTGGANTEAAKTGQDRRTWLLSPALLLGYPRPLAFRFPGPLRAIDHGFVAVLDAVVLVRIAHGSQRLVIKAGQSERDFEFLGKGVERLEMIRRSRHFVL